MKNLIVFLLAFAFFACEQQPNLLIEGDGSEAVAVRSANSGTAFIQASSAVTQAAGGVVTIETTDNANKITNRGDGFQVEKKGDYLIIAAPQVGIDGEGGGFFTCWIAINGEDVSNSNVLLGVEPGIKDVIISQSIVTLEAGDVVQVKTGSTDPDIILEAIAPQGEPLVPAIIFSMYEIN